MADAQSSLTTELRASLLYILRHSLSPPCSMLDYVSSHECTGTSAGWSLGVNFRSGPTGSRSKRHLTVDEFSALADVKAPRMDVAVHLHRRQDKVLIYVEVHHMLGIQPFIAVQHMTPRLRESDNSSLSF